MAVSNPLGKEPVLGRIPDDRDAGEVKAGLLREALDFVAEMEMAVHGDHAGFGLIIRASDGVTGLLPHRRRVAYNAVVEKLDHLLVGSCSFTAEGWETSFYPPGLKKTGYLGFYAGQFNTVEVDATFYGVPSEKTVRRWYEQTPENFVFACKVPQSITHDSWLVNCDEEFREFVNVMSELKHKLGPMLFQFPYYNRKAAVGPKEFVDRLRAFLPKLPGDFRFAVEIRNKDWVGAELLDLLRKYRVAFALIDHPYMSRPTELMRSGDIVTTDFVYVRLLGDRYAIEQLTRTWSKPVVDRSRELAEWSAVVDQLLAREMKSLYVCEQSLRRALARDSAAVSGDASPAPAEGAE